MIGLFKVDPDHDAFVIDEMMLALIAFDVKLAIDIALHLPHRLIRHAAMIATKLHPTTSAQAVDPDLLSSVDIRCWRALMGLIERKQPLPGFRLDPRNLIFPNTAEVFR